MTATVVKLNTLTNPVWPASQDKHLPVVGGGHLAVPIITAVHVRGVCLKLSSASIHTLVTWDHTKGLAFAAYLHHRTACKIWHSKFIIQYLKSRVQEEGVGLIPLEPEPSPLLCLLAAYAI
jgi:hypothetical protein